MQFDSHLSTSTECQKVADDLINNTTGEFDLGVLFISPSTQFAPAELTTLLKQKIKIKNLIGCTCAGIIGSSCELERTPATVLSLANLPDVKITPFSMTQAQLESLQESNDYYRYFEVYPTEKPVFIVLPDPFAFDLNIFLENLNKFYPSCPVIGGLASAATSPGQNTLILNSEQYTEGVVGLVLTGNVRVETVVSQGCRPFGETFIVTKSDGNVIHSLAGRPFAEVLQEVLKKSSPEERMLAQGALFIGVAMDEYKYAFKRGDFLIRGLMGIDPATGAGIVADYVESGQTIQFHIRDAMTAQEDLHELLKGQQNKEQGTKPCGALVFSCNGRGENLFRQKDHDIRIIQQHIGSVPLAGFFCAGEIGPVGGSNFLHGFTSSIALFYPRNTGVA